MIHGNNLKIVPYKDLKKNLPAGNKLEALYEKAKDKTKFDESLFAVYDGDIETETLDLHDIYWDVFYKYVSENEDLRLYQPVVLGNVHCSVLSFFEGLIAGNSFTPQKTEVNMLPGKQTGAAIPWKSLQPVSTKNCWTWSIKTLVPV